MKKIVSVILALALCLAMCGCAESFTGGWSVNAAENAAIDETAMTAFNTAFDGFVGSNVEPICLLGTQVVAGTNYCFLCRVTGVYPDAVPYYALVYVYADLNGNAEVLGFNEIYMDAGLYDYESDEADSMTVVSQALNEAEWADYEYELTEDGTENETYVLEDGALVLTVQRLAAGDFGTVNGVAAAEWFKNTMDADCGEAAELTVDGYPAAKYQFVYGSNEDTRNVTAVVVYTDEWTFVLNFFCGADAWADNTDGCQNLVSDIIDTLEIDYAKG